MSVVPKPVMPPRNSFRAKVALGLLHFKRIDDWSRDLVWYLGRVWFFTWFMIHQVSTNLFGVLDYSMNYSSLTARELEHLPLAAVKHLRHNYSYISPVACLITRKPSERQVMSCVELQCGRCFVEYQQVSAV